ncbi:hypothetical protein [Bacillus atrophaeus]|uniref:hypothetical protein n=1 Tax=Bacillus atrophaeus TaxID=1452 RepID=UPI002E22C10F|nr:hypothetical protein [Bacillus atrophaeus]
MTKKELISNMELVMMDLVKFKNDFADTLDAEEMKELDQEVKATAKAFNVLLNRSFKNNKERIARQPWVYETMLAEKELAK